jgi:hypothetical protein
MALPQCERPSFTPLQNNRQSSHIPYISLFGTLSCIQCCMAWGVYDFIKCLIEKIIVCCCCIWILKF